MSATGAYLSETDDQVLAPAEAVSVALTHDLAALEPDWRRLEAQGVETVGQSFDFTARWVAAFAVPARDQLYLSASLAGRVVAILPLCRTRSHGVRTAGWMPGDHVGANGPLVDPAAFGRLEPEARIALWRRMVRQIQGCDLLYLPAVLSAPETGFAQAFKSAAAVDRLHRARFGDWAECDSARRDKRRRKVDRQQGAKLDAQGAVGFEAVEDAALASDIIETMFAQRAARFKMQGIRNPFADPKVVAFYRDLFASAGPLRPVLHVLRLDGAVVAVRYNLVHGRTMFCLISSMSDCETIQSGSPGKQTLLRVMQTIFEDGIAAFDMGKGETDEKRLWCNEAIPLVDCYAPLSPLGHLSRAGHGAKKRLRGTIKNNARLFDLAKRARSALARRRG